MKKALVVCLVLLCLSACISQRGYLDKGNTFFEQRKYVDAEINYRKAIQKDPKYGEAFYRLGLTEIQENNLPEAYYALLRASQLLPGDIAVKEKFGDLCLQYYLRDPSRPQKLYQDIKQTSQDLLARNHDSFDGLRLAGFLAVEDRKPQEAIADFRKALQVKPWDPPLTTALVQVLKANGQAQEAETLALNLMARRKNYGPIYDVMYNWYIGANRVADAERVMKSKVENNPLRPDYILSLAKHYWTVGNQAEMKSTLGRILDHPKDFPKGDLLVGDFYLQQKDYSDAVRYYDQGAKSDPKEKIAFQKRAVGAMLAEGNTGQASSSIQNILKENPKDPLARRLHADLLIERGRPQDAETAINILEKLSAESASEIDPALRFQLARAYRLKGDLNSARAQLLEALKLRKDYPPAQYALAEINLAQHRPAEALQYANAVLAVHRNDPRARLLHAQSQLETGDAAGAKSELINLIKEFPQDNQPKLELGMLSLAQKHYPEAINILGKLPESDARVAAALSDAYASQRQFDKALAVLNQGLKQSPASELLLGQRAQILALSGQLDASVAQFQKMVSADPKSPVIRMHMAEVYQRKGDGAKAIEMFQQAHELAPDDVAMSLALADALNQAGKTAEAKAQYQSVVKAHPDNPAALNNAAFFLSDNGGNLDEALKLAQSAVEKMPGQPGFSDTLGYVYLKKGQNASAIQTFTNLVRKYPNYATFRYHLGLALYEKGDKEGARKELQTALNDHPSPKDEPRIKELLNKIT
ncbi:MAG: tetratricopeptide repeat protein [Bryobacterales bacterium]|nr:tetratricopeptide repeat protein [Bryobacterales bacterium]